MSSLIKIKIAFSIFVIVPINVSFRVSSPGNWPVSSRITLFRNMALNLLYSFSTVKVQAS